VNHACSTPCTTLALDLVGQLMVLTSQQVLSFARLTRTLYFFVIIAVAT